ncbi:hypothetical protein BSU04_14470 [Caballeronia sordidicola]|uniref:Uncharacterized protein n=1 Tax=Caballeronia sordidicola TaxID=196367 RepID=A0A226X4G7_CABSO|nr:hypothetical protein BSU04_14470 [Caballeronia sordidicola]
MAYFFRCTSRTWLLLSTRKPEPITHNGFRCKAPEPVI